MWEEQAVVLLRANGRLLFRVWTVWVLNFVEMFFVSPSTVFPKYCIVFLHRPSWRTSKIRKSIYLSKTWQFFLSFYYLFVGHFYFAILFIYPIKSTSDTQHCPETVMYKKAKYRPWIISGFFNSRSLDFFCFSQTVTVHEEAKFRV